jgi:paired amphipathic helix protein Sin3a
LHGRQAAPPTNPASAQVDKDGNGQFNLAIQYLNKIKLRYSDDPETYKQFLDILQAYKKDTCVCCLLFSITLRQPVQDAGSTGSGISSSSTLVQGCTRTLR